MILDRSRLVEVLGILSTSVSNKIIDVSNYVRFIVDKENKKVFLNTTDFHAFMMMDFGSASIVSYDDVPRIFLIDFRLLIQIVKASSTENVTFAGDSEKIFVTTNGEYRFFTYQKTEEFPIIDFDYDKLSSWPAPKIQSSWKKAVIAISDDVTKIAYQGVNYDGNLASCDNRRLSIVKVDEPSDKSILLPPIFGDVIKQCKNLVSFGINKTGNLVVVSCDEIGLIAGVRTLDAKFVPYDSLKASRSDDIVLSVPKVDLICALQRLTVLTDKIYKTVSLKIVNGPITTINLVVNNNKNIGNEVVSVLDSSFVDLNVTDVTYQYHIDNLLQAIDVTQSPDTVRLSFQDDGKVWVDEDDYCCLLNCIS